MSDEITQLLDIIKRVGDIGELAPSDDYYKAGIDSMKAMDIMLDVETEFGVAIPDDRFVHVRTADALLALIRDVRAQG